MSAVSRGELAGRAARLAQLAGSVNPGNLAATLAEATNQMGEIPGNPGGLEDLAAAFRQARTGLGTVGEDTRLTGQSRLPQAWMSGQASQHAATVTTAAGDQLRDGGEPFGRVADAMDGLAGRLRSLQDEHGSVLQAMIDAAHRADQLAAQPAAHPAVAADAVQAAAALINRGAELITETGTAHDEAHAVLTSPGAPGQGPTPDGPGRISLDQILAEYQVPPDPRGTVSYPPFPLSLAVGSQTITRTEAEMLDELGLLGQKDFKDLRDSAYDTADQRFPDQGAEDGHNDAFRHAYWNARMVQEHGADWATRFGTAHESLPGNSADRESMDLYNNEVGRQVAVENPDASPEELADLVEQAVRNGDTVVIDSNGELAYSNDVQPGGTGEADDPPTEDPGTGAGSDASGGSDTSGTGSSDYESGGS
ncbi:MAG: DUF6973 domain-containing protein [Pseudonocardiaceae bacterium]